MQKVITDDHRSDLGTALCNIDDDIDYLGTKYNYTDDDIDYVWNGHHIQSIMP